jgi:hypothetical protein
MTGRIKSRAIVIQKKTGRPVQFEITEQTRDTVARWIDTAGLRHGGGVGQKCPKRLRLPAGKRCYGAGDEGVAPSLLSDNRWSAP